MDSNLCEGIEEHIDALTLDEAWQQAYPNPREFMLFFVKKLKFYDERDKAMMLHVMKCQSECFRIDELEESERSLQIEVRDAQIEVVRSHELLVKERDKYNTLAHKHQELLLDCDDWRRKYHAVCYLTRTSDRDVAHFFQKNSNAACITDQMSQVRQEIGIVAGNKNNKYMLSNPSILGQKLEALEAKIKTQTNLNRMKINELEALYTRDNEQVSLRCETLHDGLISARQRNCEILELLNTTLHEHLNLQTVIKKNEEIWASERERLIKMVAVAHNQRFNSSMSPSTVLQTTVDNTVLVRSIKAKLSRLEIQLLEKTNILEKYKTQVLWLTKDIELHSNQALFQRQKNASDRKKLDEKIKILEKRLIDDEKRRKLEGAGFREDVKILKKTLNKLDRTIKLLVLKPTTRSVVSIPSDVFAKRCVSAPIQNLEPLQPKRKSRYGRVHVGNNPLEDDKIILEQIMNTYNHAKDKILRLAGELQDSNL